MPQRSYRVFQVDAFTQKMFAGNPAGVVLDADDLSDTEMQQIAREVGRGDTAFVLAPTSSEHDLRMRFFTPKCEVPFVGHATLAAHHVRATLSGPSPRPLRQQSGTGLISVDTRETPAGIEIGMRLPAPKAVRRLESQELDALLDALGVSHVDIEPRIPVEIYATRNARLLLGLRHAQSLETLKPNLEALARLTPHVGADGYFVFALNDAREHARVESRMFCPAIGVPEDAVSGNAHSMLGALLVRHGLLQGSGNVARLHGTQGRSVGRPGEVSVEVELRDREPQSVRISGTAVIVFQTTLQLPASR
ncbi:MAG TPA: PhzF family phenazine biosynthesis isomerase [Steroidobacteraceae bacterium]|nr:PhzF family phenazine biosynthesis isomerase [Steroidobacteraceae bacterium]